MTGSRQLLRSRRFLRLCGGCSVLVLAFAAGCGNGNQSGPGFERTDLVSNISGEAPVTDPNLTNPWGLAVAPEGPWWVSDNRSGYSTLYDGTGAPFPPASEGGPLVVTIPAPAGSAPGARGAPTGQVFNGTPDFIITQGEASGPALFIFNTEDGTISGWNFAVNFTNALLVVDNSATGANYKGLAIGAADGNNYLYAANFFAGTVEVYDKNFDQIMHDAFDDPSLPADFAPFGIQAIGGNIYVTYAKQDEDKEDDVPGNGNGYVNVFDALGNLVRRFASQGRLNSPWAVVQAPASFGRFGGDIIIGNFGDGRLNAYDPVTGDFQGQLNRPQGGALQIEGLWGLAFGNGNLAGSTDALYFTAGPNDELDGVFGMLTATQ